MHSACRITKARVCTLRIGNICSFSSSTIFRRTHSNERLHVRCLSCHMLTTHDTTPLRFMTHQKCNIAYDCCQLDSIFLWFPKLNTHPICDGIIIESYKFLCKICQLYFFGLSHFNDGNILTKHFTPNGHYMGGTVQLTSRWCILYIYSTNIRTEYLKQPS